MARPDRLVAPTVSLPAVTPPRQSHSEPTAIRRSRASRVRTSVRTQLARSHRRRRELSYASSLLRRHLREFRSHVRLRLREMSLAIIGRTPPDHEWPVPILPVAPAPAASAKDAPVPAAGESR
jgi:hypothetical protein